MKLEQVIAERSNKKIYRDGDLAIKLFDEEFSKSDILNEALNHARVEETGLNVPHIVEVTIIEGKWAIVMEYIEGKTLEQLMREHPEKIEEYMNLFVELQLEVLEKQAPLLNKIKDKMYRKIHEADIDPTLRYDLHTRLEAMPTHAKVCHGDFNPSNIIITPEGKPYILDWSHVTQGNAAADAARTYLLFRLGDDIKGAEMYLHLFCEKSNITKQYIQAWMPIVATSQSVKARPGEREFLMNWANVVDYQ